MATKRSCCCCIRFSCFSSSSSDEKEQDHPTSGAGARSSPSATDNTIETLPGAQAPIPGPSNVVTPMKNEIEHVDVSINVSGTHPGGKAPVSESLRKSEGKNVNVNLNVPESPQCNEASSSGSSNVPDRSDREDLNVNLNVSKATQCDEAPSSGSPNVPGKSEGEGVDANLNVSGAPLSNEAPSSSSSTSRVATKSNVIDTILHKDIVQTDGENVAVNLDDLMKHISKLLKLREEEMRQGKKLPNPSSNFYWPNVPGFKKLNAILSLGTDLKKLTELLSSGLEVASKLKDNISGPVTELLKGIGQASVFTAGLLVVANTLETFQDLSSNQQQCWDLIKEMSYFATIVKRFTERPRETQNDVIQDAVTLIVEGAILCCTNIERSAWKSFFSASKVKDDLSGMRQKLDAKYKQIDIEIGLRLSTDIERVFAAIAARNSPLSNEYPKHAVGIEESIEEVMKLLECDNEKNVVTVILHGFGGIGKTTLADAVFSKVEGCKYSKVQLFKDIDTKPDIVKLQEDILKDLMETQESVQIRKYEDGQKELGKILKKRQTFIYIDNVLDPDELEHLLPESEDLHEAKKVRFLLTARDKNAKLAFPSSVSTQIYDMKGIKNRQAARSILEKENMEGLDSSKLDQIIKKCDGLPLLLKLVARFIGHAGDKGAAYDQLMQEEAIWNNEKFKEMSLRLAYDALPEKCKDPFLDICSYFRRWDWDTVENIVGKNELEMLESRALVTKDTFTGVVNVHDVILELGFHMSKGKEVRLTFSSARQLMAYLEEIKEGAEGIKGIWLSGNKDVLQISASTLDSMHKSLRVVQLGHLTQVEGKCSKIFEELVFFEAKVRQLPFHNMSKLKQLKYLTYAPNELKLSKMPPSLRHMEFDGSSDSDAFQISSGDLQHLKHLRILRLVNFENLTNLCEEMGDQVTCLQELSLSNCQSIKKLPDSISKLRSLRIVEMDNCSNLTELPVDFGSLSSLQELNLARCKELKALPDSIDKLSSLKVLNLSGCKKLLNLPSGLGKLTCLVELNIESCKSLKSIPQNIGELKQLRVMNTRKCGNLKELPDGFCNLSFITHLSFGDCNSLEKLPDRFGQLKSLKMLSMRDCGTLGKLPEGFGQLKNLERLNLEDCRQFRELCNDFHCLSSLQQLDLTNCKSLEKLPEDFHFLTSLQELHLCGCERLEKLPEYFHCLNSLHILSLENCPKLEGKSMDHVTKMNTLQVVVIVGSDELVQRWGEIQRDCHGSSHPSVIISEEVSENNKEKMKNSVLSELDRLLRNGRGESVHLSDLLANTSALLIFNVDLDEDKFPWPLIEETVDDEMQIKIIYIGPHFDQLPTKVKDTIFVVHLSERHTVNILNNILLTTEGHVTADRCYLQMDAKMVGDGNSDNYAPCFSWRCLTDDEMEEFVVGNCGRYLRLKQLEAERDEASSNIEMLRELFAPHGDETTPVFQKNKSSQKDPTENSERKTTCGVDKLEGKTILVEMWPSNSWRCEINHPFWKEMYFMEKEKVDLEIISIPIVHPEKCDVIDVYKQFSRQVPWLVLQNSWTVITRAVKLFFEKHCGWEEPDECEEWYPTINWIIDPNGRISVYRPYIFLKEEWEQPKNMSTLEFLFNHSESVSAQVQKLMLPGKLICLYRGGDDDEQVMYSMWNALEQQQRDRIHIIHLGRRRMESFKFTNNIEKDYYYPLKNTAEIEGMSSLNLSGMSSLNLSENEIMRFSLRLCHLEEEINRMEESELKFLLHSFQPLHSFQYGKDCMYGSIAFMDGGGKVIAALGGLILESIFNREDRAQRFIKSIMNDIEGGGKEMHDEDPGVSDSLIQNLQTASTSVAVEQENMDAYFESLQEYISELWEMELYQASRFNKEGKKRSLPSVTWPTSRGFCRLKNFLSEGISDDWVKDIISRHPKEEDKRAIVIHGLLKDIEEAQWAVAGVLAVADVLERFQTISANGMDYLSLLEKMFRVAQYIKQFDQKPGLWRGVNRVATAIIVNYSFHCCSQIDQSKFALFSDTWYYAEWRISEISDIMAKAITEGPSNESGSLLEEMCSCVYGFRFFLESGNEGGPSCEGESGVSAVDAGSTGIDEGGPSCEGESDVSAVEAGSTATTGEE